MASINKVIIVGNLGRDPDVRDVGMGKLASFSMATSRRYRDRNGIDQTETEWHRVVFFGRAAEIAGEYLRKGSLAYVEGRLRTRKFTDSNNNERSVTEIVGETLQLLERRNTDQQQIDDGFSSAPRPRPATTEATAAPAAAPSMGTAAPIATSVDSLDEDIPF